jgi:hypothetical protein
MPRTGNSQAPMSAHREMIHAASVTNHRAPEDEMHAVVGQWPVESKLEASEIEHIASTVQRQVGPTRGYWGQEPHDGAVAHAFVVFNDEQAARTIAEGVQAAIAAARLSVFKVLVDA